MNLQTLIEKACQLQQAGRIPEALVIYEEILRDDPRNADALHLAGLSHYQTGNAKAALPLLRLAVEQTPDSALFRSNLSLVLSQSNQMPEAENEARKALELDSDHVGAQVSLGLCLSRMGKLDEAARCYQSALAIDADNFDAHNNLAKIFRDLRQHDNALDHGIAAVRIQPQNSFTHNNLANIYNDLGSLEEARSHYEKAIAIKPSYGQAWSNWAHSLKFCTKKFKAATARIQEIESQLNRDGLSAHDRGNLLFALAKARKDCGRTDEAFPLYEKANRLLCANDFPFEQYQSYLQGIKEEYSRESLSTGNTSGHDAAPVFIVGMLRSGTSLTEQILSCHSKLGGVGERKDIAVLTVQSKSGDLFNLAETYLRNIASFHDATERPADKMMTNFLHLGFISRLFPKAKIIHVKRHAYDVCLSCLFQNFASTPAWASSLDGAGQYYALYEEMMAHWQQALPLPIFELQYEELVSDPESTVREMLAYCDLPWEEGCLDFQNSKRAVQTASNWQVRQKLHTGSVGNWKQYEKFLTPLKKYLGDR